MEARLVTIVGVPLRENAHADLVERRGAERGQGLLLESVGLVGAVASSLNGPRWTGVLQLPALSRVRRWNHHWPSASGGLVVPVALSSASLAESGTVVALCDHS